MCTENSCVVHEANWMFLMLMFGVEKKYAEANWTLIFRQTVKYDL
jgi:hypothetical protein